MSTALETGRALLAQLKQVASANSLPLTIPVGQPVQALLRVIPSRAEHLNANDLSLLSDWRNRYVKSFLTEFHAHPERTANWLCQHVHHNDGKILFMLESLDGQAWGHIGLAFIDWQSAYGEADAIVNGGGAPRGMMKQGLQACLRWAKESLGLQTLGVRVRSDNPAVEFYKKVGFQEIKRVALAHEVDGEAINWFEDPSLSGDVPALVYMIYHEASA